MHCDSLVHFDVLMHAMLRWVFFVCRSGEDHRSLPDVLRDLQSQLAGQEPAQVPGQSLARPLHVVLQVHPLCNPSGLSHVCLSWE